jgi:hypothetical protein
MADASALRVQVTTRPNRGYFDPAILSNPILEQLWNQSTLGSIEHDHSDGALIDTVSIAFTKSEIQVNNVIRLMNAR